MEATSLKTKKSTSLQKSTKVTPSQKPQKKTKVILGGGTKYGWMSDTLFDEDLKGW